MILSQYRYRTVVGRKEEMKFILSERFNGTCSVHECLGSHVSFMADDRQLRIAHYRKKTNGFLNIRDESLRPFTEQLVETIKTIK